MLRLAGEHGRPSHRVSLHIARNVQLEVARDAQDIRNAGEEIADSDARLKHRIPLIRAYVSEAAVASQDLAVGENDHAAAVTLRPLKLNSPKSLDHLSHSWEMNRFERAGIQLYTQDRRRNSEGMIVYRHVSWYQTGGMADNPSG